MPAPWLYLLRSLALALGLSLFASLILLVLPINASARLGALMGASGISSTLAGYLLYRLGWLRHLPSLRWLLVLLISVTVGLVLINMWALTQQLLLGAVYLNIVLAMLGFSALAALSFGFFIARALTERLSQLQDATHAIAAGALHTRLNPHGNDEIAALASTFNHMAAQLQQAQAEELRLHASRRDLIAWVTHDLRTPLASMRAMLEALADGIIRDEATQRHYLRATLSEIDYLTHLTDDLFDLAQLDLQKLELRYSTFSLSDLLSDMYASFQAKANDKHITLYSTLSPDADTLYADAARIQRVLANLLDNAIKYSPAGAHVTISSAQAHHSYLISVSNSGTQLAPDQLARLFERFYRGQASRTNADGERGAGLGLSIAQGIVEAHGGRIWAEQHAETTRFTFTLPQGKSI